MAVERAAGPMGPMEMESSAMAEPSEEAARAFIPAELAHGAKPGDVLRLKVVSVDDEDGSVEVEYATEEAPTREMGPDTSNMDRYFAQRGAGSPPTD